MKSGDKILCPDGTITNIVAFDADIKMFFVFISGAKCFVNGDDYILLTEADQTICEHNWDQKIGYCRKCGLKIKTIKSADITGFSIMRDGSFQPDLRNVEFE